MRLVLAAVAALWLISRWSSQWNVSAKAGTGPADILSGDVDALNANERRNWAQWLAVSEWPSMLDEIEGLAEENGGPADWAARGWNTPCGGDGNRHQFCSHTDLAKLRVASLALDESNKLYTGKATA